LTSLHIFCPPFYLFVVFCWYRRTSSSEFYVFGWILWWVTGGDHSYVEQISHVHNLPKNVSPSRLPHHQCVDPGTDSLSRPHLQINYTDLVENSCPERISDQENQPHWPLNINVNIKRNWSNSSGILLGRVDVSLSGCRNNKQLKWS
jgi:hypothetical protein